ncbi:class A beta-lactamase-related serine hydrolase [Arthrobacter crusticola]|uniref:Class A beta-lactamase-related serine hydrolase n=1 Tax=Arthrobacter crusticola TaxID=2547960 RepID=A0A4R5TTH7_9MICC|nr:serine hydrolase domain-containing protein [Arthrobacter crusticola]TDK23930.1 class A beta-lactamase-related serine hydrolase [Arthrobacter crusticola]
MFVKPLVIITASLALLGAGLPGATASTGGSLEQRAPERAASIPESEVQPYLDAMTDEGIPGVVAHVRSGEDSISLSSGAADLAQAEAMTPGHKVRVGSYTKTFTATMLLQLVDEGSVSLEDSVEKWLPGLVPGGENIKLRQLLNHTSGLFDYTYDQAVMAPYLNPDGTFTVSNHYSSPTELVNAATSHAPNFTPGSDWSYSNTNYILAGLVLEAATGRTYAQELHARIIGPLNLKGTQFPEKRTSIQEPTAHGYQLYGDDSGPMDVTRMSPSFSWAAGGLTSTVEDMSRFGAALVGGELLSEARLAEMKTVVSAPEDGLAYGLGLTRIDVCGVTLWGHGGDVPGYHSNSFVSGDGKIQISMVATAGLDTWNAEQGANWSSAMHAAICP